jgi:hypothetical protein
MSDPLRDLDSRLGCNPISALKKSATSMRDLWEGVANREPNDVSDGNSSDLRDPSAAAPETGHYDDSHGFGWKQPDRPPADWTHLAPPPEGLDAISERLSAEDATDSPATDEAPSAKTSVAKAASDGGSGKRVAVGGLLGAIAAVVALVVALSGGGDSTKKESSRTRPTDVAVPTGPRAAWTTETVNVGSDCVAQVIVHVTVQGAKYVGKQGILHVTGTDTVDLPFTVGPNGKTDVPFTQHGLPSGPGSCRSTNEYSVPTVDGQRVIGLPVG